MEFIYKKKAVFHQDTDEASIFMHSCINFVVLLLKLNVPEEVAASKLFNRSLYCKYIHIRGNTTLFLNLQNMFRSVHQAIIS